MKVPEILKRRGGLLLAGALVVTGGWVAISGPQGLQNLLEKRREIRELEERNAALVQENADRRDRIRKMTGSPTEQELIIRGDLKLGKPGETTFILPTPGHETPAPPDPKVDSDKSSR